MKTTNVTTQADVKLNVLAANNSANTNAAGESALVKKEVINKVSIIGYMGNDPEITEFTGGMKKAKFRAATNRYFKNKQGEWQNETTWHNVIAWSSLAERAASKLKTGMPVSVEGRLNYRMYVDEKGVQRFYTEIIASSIIDIPAKAKAASLETETMKIAA